MDEYNKQVWIVTFADLLSLMLTFFILLFSFSELNEKDWYSVVSNTKSEFEIIKKSSSNASTIEGRYGMDLGYLEAVLNNKFVNEYGYVQVKNEGHRLIVSFPGEVFRSEKQLYDNKVDSVMHVIADLVSQMTNSIYVISYIDSDQSQLDQEWENVLMNAFEISQDIKKLGYVEDINIFAGSSNSNDPKTGIDLVINEISDDIPNMNEDEGL